MAVVKNVIFDLGGVLVDFAPGKVMEKAGYSPEEIQHILSKTVFSEHWVELDRGAINRQEVNATMLETIEEPFKEKAQKFLEELIFDAVHTFDYSREWVKSIKDKNLNIYLLTNYPGWLFDYHFENEFTFSEFVDGMIVSGKEKLVKPDTRIYQNLLSKYNLEGKESVFIDDRKENVEGAISCGIHGIHFTNLEEVKKQLSVLID